MDSGDSISGVTQPKKGKKETIGAPNTNLSHSQPSHFSGSGSTRGTKIAEHEDHAEGTGENQVIEGQSTFGFPIVDSETTTQMKNIPPSTLPHFYVMVHEDPESFLFEFYILCRSYDYSSNAHKLKLFPATLKDSALC